MTFDGPAELGTVLRPTARVLLVDDRDRTLLFHMVGEDTGDTFWMPPGGALDPGETHEAAAARELREETGWTEPVIGPMIGYRQYVITWSGVRYDCREQCFLARVPSLEVDTSGFTEDEKRETLEHRWWSVEELASTSDRLFPAALPELLRIVIEDGPPTQPLML
jgi:8-oxo-dGTP pyrophosphatase MutT (NUDIX family)